MKGIVFGMNKKCCKTKVKTGIIAGRRRRRRREEGGGRREEEGGRDNYSSGMVFRAEEIN